MEELDLDRTGQRMASIRKAAKLTQQELAWWMGAAHSTLSEYERNAMKVPSRLFYRRFKEEIVFEIFRRTLHARGRWDEYDRDKHPDIRCSRSYMVAANQDRYQCNRFWALAMLIGQDELDSLFAEHAPLSLESCDWDTGEFLPAMAALTSLPAPYDSFTSNYQDRKD